MTFYIEKLQHFSLQATNILLAGFQRYFILFAIFFVIEFLFFYKKNKKRVDQYLLDFKYALIGLFYSPFLHFVLFSVFGIKSLNSQDNISSLESYEFFGQLFLILLIRDLLIYIRHRIFHSRTIWPFHSIHHSSEDLNWISTARFHPVESLIEIFLEIVLFASLVYFGFSLSIIALASLIIGFYNFLIHSNCNWTFGALGRIFVSPVLHRWHHSADKAAIDKNFAAMFSFIDIMFGTYYMPVDKQPELLGLPQSQTKVFPRKFIDQVFFPFRKK